MAETVEHVTAGFPVPTDRRIVFEDWEEFVIIHANFGSLANRALAQLIGQLLSEKIGRGIVVQTDPYRIFVQTVRDSLTLATVKTGLFKRRMIHVARRFGALEKWADFSSVSLQRLVKSFEGTPIYEEALKEVFTKDLDLQRLISILEKIRDGEIQLQKIDTGGNATPV